MVLLGRLYDGWRRWSIAEIQHEVEFAFLNAVEDIHHVIDVLVLEELHHCDFTALPVDRRKTGGGLHLRNYLDATDSSILRGTPPRAHGVAFPIAATAYVCLCFVASWKNRPCFFSFLAPPGKNDPVFLSFVARAGKSDPLFFICGLARKT